MSNIPPGHVSRPHGLTNLGFRDGQSCFFFSSRRRHTRFDGDWSSDVCSSDLVFLSDRVIVFTARPGKVKLSLPIALPRPRPPEIKRDPRFIEYEGAVWQCIREEDRKSVV